MNWEITAAGTVHLDDVTTPMGREPRLCGGSAVYFSLAAANFAPVHACGIVGADSAAEFRALLRGHPIDTDGIVVSETPTFHWHATHDFERWIAVETGADGGCDHEWIPNLPPAARAAQVLFLGSMDPAKQLAVLEQSQAQLVGSDSMTVFIDAQREAVRRVVEASDILFLNRTELEALLPEAKDDWRAAARSLCGRGRTRAVVVKAGPNGATCITAQQEIQRNAAPVRRVVDPTGAGDTLAGGFLGACARSERSDEEFFATALETGLQYAARAISAFGTADLLDQYSVA